MLLTNHRYDRRPVDGCKIRSTPTGLHLSNFNPFVYCQADIVFVVDDNDYTQSKMSQIKAYRTFLIRHRLFYFARRFRLNGRIRFRWDYSKMDSVPCLMWEGLCGLQLVLSRHKDATVAITESFESSRIKCSTSLLNLLIDD